MDESTIKALHEEIKRLNAELAETREEAKKYRLSRKQLAEEHNKLLAEHGDVVKERDGLQARAKDPTTAERELAELREQVRTRDHKDAFVRVAKAAGVRDDALEDVWLVSKYTPEGDQPDEGRIKSLVSEVTKSKPYYLAAKEEPAAPETPKALQPGPGLDRGGDGGLGVFVVKESDTRNIRFMEQNQKAIAAANKRGAFQLLMGQ